MNIDEALEVVALGGSSIDAHDLEALRVVVHFAIDHKDCAARRLLNLTSPETIEKAGAKIREITGCTQRTSESIAEAVLRSVEEGTG